MLQHVQNLNMSDISCGIRMDLLLNGDAPCNTKHATSTGHPYYVEDGNTIGVWSVYELRRQTKNRIQGTIIES
jgi:hypothetical protein